jgi:hypothetical protein
MKPLDDPAGHTPSTGSGRVASPAARSPVRRAAQTGGPGTVTSAPVPGGNTPSPPFEPEADAGKAVPGLGASGTLPGPGRHQGLSGREGLDAWRRAESAHKAGQRRARFKAAPKATGPGMIRRAPQGGPNDAT